MPIRKIKGSLVKQGLEEYVGESTYLFYDTTTGELRLWDGNPGGIAPRYPTSTIDWATQIGIPPIHGGTLDSALDHIYSAGFLERGPIVDNGDGTIDVGPSSLYIRPTDDPHAELILTSVALQENIALTDNSTNYVYVDYNAGAPEFRVTLDPTTINVTTKVPHSIVVREGLFLNIIALADDNVDANAKLRKRYFFTERFTYASGAVISSPSLLTVAATTGEFYFGLSPITQPAIDTSVTGDFEYYWTANSGTTWTETDETSLDDAFYNDITSGKSAVGNGNYVNHWIYAIPSTEGTAHYAVVYGQAQYTTFANAIAEPIPVVVPPSVLHIGILLGVYTTQEGVTTPVEIRSAFTSSLTVGTVTSHLNLSDVGTTTHAQIDNQIPLTGSGTPEGAVTANVGRLYTDTAGGAGTTLYVKESGAGNTGWVAK